MNTATRRSWSVAQRAALVSVAVASAVGSAQGQVAREDVPLSVRQQQARQRLLGDAPHPAPPAHPTLTAPMLNAPPADFGLPIGLEGGGGIPIPPLSPLSRGFYVNYDSPPVKPIALSTTGEHLFVADTPNHWLTVLSVPTVPFGGPVGLVRHIPVGMEPVCVAVQPMPTADTANTLVWTANFLSDDVSVVNVLTGQVEAVIPVGDEPVNIVFNPSGTFAFVVTQGPTKNALSGTVLDPRGGLTVIDTVHREIVFSRQLDCNTPRAMVYDRPTQRLMIAALHSGNDTTVVGTPTTMILTNSQQVSISTLRVAQAFSVTQGVFVNSPELSPWPDHSGVPGEPSPEVNRVIRTRAGPWQQIVALLTLPGGGLNPAIVSQFATEFGCTNAADVLTAVITDQPQRTDRDLMVFDVSHPTNPTLLATYPRIGTTITAMDGHPTQARVLLANLEPRNTTRLEPNLRGRFMTHEIRQVHLGFGPVPPPNPQVQRFNLHGQIAAFDNADAINPPAQAGSLANPVDVVYDQTGDRAFVASLGADRVGVIDTQTGAVHAIVDVDRGPRGLAYNASGGVLFCFCRTDFSIVAIDVTGPDPVVMQRFPLFTPELAVISEGRHFLYTTKVSNNFSSSCAMCHIDGNLDHLAWDLGDNTGNSMLPAPSSVSPLLNHPVKGPMVTQSLRGLEKHNAFHWRGDKPQFTDFNSAFDGLLGGSQISDSDMSRYDNYVRSLVYGPNPFYRRDNSFISPIALAGAATYASSCNPCHDFTNDGTLRFPGASDDVAIPLANLSAQIQEIAQLRGLYKKAQSDVFNGFGLLHDGRTSRESTPSAIESFLVTFFGFIPAQDRTNMADTLMSFPGNSMAVVGWQRLARAGLSVDENALLLQDLALMVSEAHASPAHCDLVARGFIFGKDVGYVLLPPVASPNLPTPVNFKGDDGTQATLQELLDAVQVGGTLTFMAVPPGSGERIGIDADHDGFINFGPGEVLAHNTSDFNHDGITSPDDLDEFITAYFESPPSVYADFNQDGIVSPDDLDLYISEFFRF